MGSGVSGGRGLSQTDATEEGGVVAHGDGGVLVHHADGDALFGTEPTHACSVTGVELPLSGLDAPRAAQERILINHHLIARNVREVQVVHLCICSMHATTHTTKDAQNNRTV